MKGINIFYFYYLFIFGYAGSSFCVCDFFSCSEWGLLWVLVLRLLIAVASLVAPCDLQSMGSVAVVYWLIFP